MPVSFDHIAINSRWERIELSRLWGYESFHALARGVFTPRGSNKIILFVKEEKRDGDEPYSDTFEGDTLHWHGEKGHGNDERIVSAAARGDETHVFYRAIHRAPFTYLGKAQLVSSELLQTEPSRFVFRLPQIR